MRDGVKHRKAHIERGNRVKELSCNKECWELLDYREQQLLRLRYMLGEDGATIEEAGRIFKVTKERIRQIESKALRKMESVNL